MSEILEVDEPITPMTAPMPYFGGKRRVAELVWSRLGNVPNYIEPFAGSLAVLLGRPHKPKIETVNDSVSLFVPVTSCVTAIIPYCARKVKNYGLQPAWQRTIQTRQSKPNSRKVASDGDAHHKAICRYIFASV